MNLTHPFGHVEFNPTASQAQRITGFSTSGSDTGFSNGGGPHANNPTQTQRLDTLISAILRIDPCSPAVSKGDEGIDYTILLINKFRRRWRSENIRRDLRLRFPQRAQALVGHDG